jgi:hypothetical protein
MVIRSINGKRAPLHAKGSNAQSYAVGLALPEGQYSFKIYKQGYAKVDGLSDVTVDLSIVAGHNYVAVTIPVRGGLTSLRVSDYGFGSVCTGRYVKVIGVDYDHVITCTEGAAAR